MEALIGVIGRLSVWGHRVARSEPSSGELQRAIEVLDDVFDEAYDAWRAMRPRQEDEGDDLALALNGLVASLAEVRDKLSEAAEAAKDDPREQAEIVNFLHHRERSRPEAVRHVEAS